MFSFSPLFIHCIPFSAASTAEQTRTALELSLAKKVCRQDSTHGDHQMRNDLELPLEFDALCEELEVPNSPEY